MTTLDNPYNLFPIRYLEVKAQVLTYLSQLCSVVQPPSRPAGMACLAPMDSLHVGRLLSHGSILPLVLGLSPLQSFEDGDVGCLDG